MWITITSVTYWTVDKSEQLMLKPTDFEHLQKGSLKKEGIRNLLDRNQDEISMNESIRSYMEHLPKTEQARYVVCDDNVKRPTNIHLHKGFYQRLMYVIDDDYYKPGEIFIMNFYYDDRFFKDKGTSYIRGIVSVRCPYGERSDRNDWNWAMKTLAEINTVLWYEHFTSPISTKCYFKNAAGLARKVEAVYYYQYHIVCPVPNITPLPSKATLTQSDCEVTDTYITIVYPDAPSHPGSNNTDIGICTASLYGSLSDQDVPHTVSWFESIFMFGVTEVTLNIASLSFQGDHIKKVFQYYTAIGKLTLTHYPPAHRTLYNATKTQIDAATESFNKLTTGDCFYRNIRRYWWVLIIDMDELPVPKTGSTYQESLRFLMQNKPRAKNAHCFGVKSVVFPRNTDSGNKDYPRYLPYLRLTKRIPIHPIIVRRGKKKGRLTNEVYKSFHNPRNVVSSGHHFCSFTHKKSRKHIVKEYIPEDVMVIHHYRDRCKFIEDCQSQEKQDFVHDDYLVKFYGQVIKSQVEMVLRKVGYLK